MTNAKKPYEARCNLQSVAYIEYFAKPLGMYFNRMRWRRIGILGSESAFPTLQAHVNGFEYVRLNLEGAWSDFSRVDIILDFAFDKYMRRFLPSQEKFKSLCDILAKIAIEELRDYAQERRIDLLLIDGPQDKKIPNLEAAERCHIEKHDSFNDMAKDGRFLRNFCATDKDYRYALNPQGVFGGWVRTFNGYYECLADVESEFINVKDGVRYTVSVPPHPVRTIHVFGSCLVLGACVSDENTFESYLQQRFNAAGKKWAVVNHGVGDGRFLLNTIIYAMSVPMSEADVIVILDHLPPTISDDTIAASAWFLEKRSNEVMFFNSAYHTNARANMIIATQLDKLISPCEGDYGERMSYFAFKGIKFDKILRPELYSDKFIPYLRYLSRLHRDVEGACAAVLINADPFTLGHRYLIEGALKLFSHVYVFLLDQKSYFSFDERYEMARRGVEGLSVTIIRTEEFYASSRNFPEYFNRDTYVEGADLSDTVEIELRVLIEKIFPFLRIKARFLGEERLGSVTWKYNELVRRVDAEYGIETRVLPRLTVEGDIVSASTVRKLFTDGKLAAIQQLVPTGVAEYLVWLSERKI